MYNLRAKRAMLESMKEVQSLKGGDRKEQQASLASAYQAIDKALKRGIIKKNTAARKKSRLAKHLKTVAK